MFPLFLPRHYYCSQEPFDLETNNKTFSRNIILYNTTVSMCSFDIKLRSWTLWLILSDGKTGILFVWKAGLSNNKKPTCVIITYTIRFRDFITYSQNCIQSLTLILCKNLKAAQYFFSDNLLKSRGFCSKRLTIDRVLSLTSAYKCL